MKKTKTKRKILAIVMTAALAMQITALPIFAAGDETIVSIDMEDYSYVVFKDDGVYSASDMYLSGTSIFTNDDVKIADSGTDFIFTGTGKTTIAVLSGEHNITFNGVSVTTSNSFGCVYIDTGATANIIVADDSVNTLSSTGTAAAITVNEAVLNIDGGTENNGTLSVSAAQCNGIGSSFDWEGYSNPFGNITISGAVITATGNYDGTGIGGSEGTILITDNANVTASGYAGAGIGSSGIANDSTGGAKDVDITISGNAIVKADSSNGGAAIGGGYNSFTGDITISGNADVTASGGADSTGIGGGTSQYTYAGYGSAGNITISGNAKVIATGGDKCAAIGSGTWYKGADGTITISDSATVTATGGTYGAGIGTSSGSFVNSIEITGGTVIASGGVYVIGSLTYSGAGIGAGYYGGIRDISISGGDVKAYGTSYSAVIGGGCSAYGGNISITDDAYVVAIPATDGTVIGDGNVGSGYNTGYASSGVVNSSAVINIENAGNFVAYFTSSFGDCTFTNTGDVEFIQLNYFSTQVGNGTTTIKDSTGTTVASFSLDETYYGVILGVPSSDDTYTVYYDEIQQMHQNELVEGQFSTDFTVDNFVRYADVQNAALASITLTSTTLTMDYYDENKTISASVSNPNAIFYTNTYQWQIENSDGVFEDITNATGTTYTIPQTTDAGIYNYRLVATSTYNYNDGVPMTQVVSDIITVTVEPIEVTVEIDDIEITRGMEIPTLTGTVTGDITDEVEPVYTVTADNMVAGNYTIGMSNVDDYGNYDIDVIDGTLIITDGYTVSIDGVEITDVAYGDTVTKPADPTKDGYTFVGWEVDGEAFDFDTIITQDIDIVSTWKADTEASQEVVTEGTAAVNPVLADDTLETVFTEDELASGDDLKVVLNADELDIDAIDETEKTAIEEAIISLSEEGVFAFALDLTLEKFINGESTGYVTDANGMITITIDIPEEYQADGRVFSIVRVHDGVAEVLEDLDDDPTTITFQTDKFSTYAVAYVDADVISVGDGYSVDTGDSTPYTAIGLLIIAMLGMATMIVRRRIQDNK